MLSCQRHLFAIEREVVFFNSASYSPLPSPVQRAGEKGVGEKVRPWRRDAQAAHVVVEAAREEAARLIGASADDIAIVGAASYGIATALANLRLRAGTRVLLLEGEHSSLHLALTSFARSTGMHLDIVMRPKNGDWTTAVLERIDDQGAPPIGLAALTPLHWTDGSLVGLSRIVPELHRRRAAVLMDATQAAGVMSLDVSELRPDYLMFPVYKWLLGPYGLAFLYVAPQWQGGRPLEEHGFNRKSYDSATKSSVEALPYLDGARRFDRGERDSFITIPMARACLELIHAWEVTEIQVRLRMLTDLLAGRLMEFGIDTAPGHLRAPHILGFRLPKAGAAEIAREMEHAGIFVSARHDFLRLSPHVFNDEEDVERFSEWMRRYLASRKRA
ncbi:MAG: aminotransferase class V-fold PLP-dependent enzyme [Hyphomicrobiales bacterium]|nr:aminotransferase class V-fold PLP-dependent enzyme [Hyphomicrobiales bacterium]